MAMPVITFRPHPTPKANCRVTCRTIREFPARLGDDVVLRMPCYICKGAGSHFRLRRRSVRTANSAILPRDHEHNGITHSREGPDIRHWASGDDVSRGIDNGVEGEAGFWQLGCGRSSSMTAPSGLWRRRVLRTHGPTPPAI